MQPIDDRFEPLYQVWVTIPELVKCTGLLLEYGEDNIRRVASINQVGEWVIAEIFSSAFGVLFQGHIKGSLEVVWSG